MTPATEARKRVVFLLDVDNTLLDNDRVTADLKHYLTGEIGTNRLSSKTFTTLETMTNARTAREWSLRALRDEQAVAKRPSQRRHTCKSE